MRSGRPSGRRPGPDRGAHGGVVPISSAKPDDLAFFANPEHVVVCIGDGEAVSHGHQGDPEIISLVGYYRPVQEVRRY